MSAASVKKWSGIAVVSAVLLSPLSMLETGPALAGAQPEKQVIHKKHYRTFEHRYFKGRRSGRTNFATRPGEPNQAGMTDDCANWYNIYGRMLPGCDANGRSFY